MVAEMVGRASLRRIGLTDDRIDRMTMHECKTALAVDRVLGELAKERMAEEAWMAKAIADGQSIPIKQLDPTELMQSG